MGELITLGKFGEEFWKEGGNDGRGKKGRERKKRRKGNDRQGKRENGEENEGKIEENLKLKGERYEMSRGLSFFFFACHFLKPLKFVWGVPKWKFLGEIF